MSLRENNNGRKKILIVDDSEINRSLLSDMLSDEFDILEAENGMEAAAILHVREHEIALMLLDIVMPVMDGFEMLTVMNENGWIKSTPVIMISAETVPAYVDKAYDLGVLDYISRPFDERTVRRRVISTIMLAAKQKELSYMVADQIYEKEKDNRMMIEILSNLVEFRNGESGLHVIHIRMLTELLLKSLMEKTDQYKISKKDIPLICNASALHDIGKIAVPMEILNKPGRLTKEEFEIMKTHSAEGAKILGCIPMREKESLIQIGYQICRWLHERYDGKGYPDGLKGEEIPIAAQVVALADVYDALTSKRVYKEAYSHEKAMQMILDGESGNFNPLLLECLMDLSPILKEEWDSPLTGENPQKEIRSIVGHIMEKEELGVSERTLQLLEHERMKYHFLADLSSEVLFEYRAMPEMILLSEWGAAYLNMPETILNPREEAFGNRIFSRKDFSHLLERLKGTTIQNPVIEENYLLNINSCLRWSKVITYSIWSEGEQPKFEGAIGKIVDIHDHMVKVSELELMAAQDSLTGLLNHAAAKEKISSILSKDKEGKYMLIMADLDHFKEANDRFGHLFGDEVLRYAADKIRACTRSTDIVSRVGGDEFLVFMEYHEEGKAQVERIFHQLSGRYKEFVLSVSMGIVCIKGWDKDYKSLFHLADKAMYKAKLRGRGRYYFYEK